MAVDMLSPQMDGEQRLRPAEFSGDFIHESSVSPPGQGPDSSASEKIQLPVYLRQSRAEIREKFHDLEWRERERVRQAHQGSDDPLPWAQDQEPEVKARNRYLNVQPWAYNRIRLKVPPDQCDYINASPIVLTSPTTGQEKKYIATQGPQEGQLHHLWQMIWDETSEPAVIVMLTQTSEGGRDKCFQYFPEGLENDTLTVTEDVEDGEDNEDSEGGDDGEDNEDQTREPFSATIKLLEIKEDTASRCTIRKLLLTVREESKIVWHFLFWGWRDFGIPEEDDRAALLELMRVSVEKASSPDNPRIIHCSAGVGRSGTFIALDFLLEEIAHGSGESPEADSDSDLICDTVDTLRQQRMMMVQNEAQFHFIYEVLKERWLAMQAQAHEDDPSMHDAILQASKDVPHDSSAEAKALSERGQASILEG